MDAGTDHAKGVIYAGGGDVMSTLRTQLPLQSTEVHHLGRIHQQQEQDTSPSPRLPPTTFLKAVHYAGFLQHSSAAV